MIHEPELDWFKSSYSDSGDINDCVEVAHAPGQVRVRDSKDTALPHLTVTPTAWTGFVTYASGR
ncbi:DUF397 domain-containing protein [Streptomyces subrutilus]|uniref:DUF397 domain-containing protein n=1 Tax=Streptomyces subrutilus TaxID=36818 RepID=UPI0033FE163A